MNFLEINIFGKTGDPLVILLISILGGVVLYNLFLVGCLFFTSLKIRKLKSNVNYEDEAKLAKLQLKLEEQEEQIRQREENFEKHVDEWNSKEPEFSSKESKIAFEVESLKEKDWKKVEEYIEAHPEDWVNFALKLNPKSRFWLGLKAQLDGMVVAKNSYNETNIVEDSQEINPIEDSLNTSNSKGSFKSRKQESAKQPVDLVTNEHLTETVSTEDQQAAPIIQEKRGWFGRRKKQLQPQMTTEAAPNQTGQQFQSKPIPTQNNQIFVEDCENITKEISNNNFYEDRMVFKQDFEVESDIYKKSIDDDLFVNMEDIIGAKEEEKNSKSEIARFSLFRGRQDRVVPLVKKNIFTNSSIKKFNNRKEQVEEDIKTLELELEK